jgi:hypothetical protein
VSGDICSLCCGQEREVTVDCPLDCVYLQEAHKHEHPEPVNPDDVPNRDIRVTEEFLEEHPELLAAAARSVLDAALDIPGAADRDVRDALDSLIRTLRTLQSGVYYESRPVNVLASGIYDATQSALEEFRKQEKEQLGMAQTRDTDVLGVLVFLQRLEWDRNNGRPKSRAFLDFLDDTFGEEEDAPDAPVSSLILP